MAWTGRDVGRWLLAAFLVFAGTAHFWNLSEFRAQVPPWVPVDVDPVIIVSGVVEIVLGLALMLLARHRAWVGWLVAGLFVVVFPGNLAQYTEARDAFGLDTDGARLTRLFFQPLLIAWALWCTEAWRLLRTGRRDP